jgi:nitroimidazol reductase NimA-like FMN-containing flavoprotein (pyridoxamine 5'-phosphate oxidase superfamily)
VSFQFNAHGESMDKDPTNATARDLAYLDVTTCWALLRQVELGRLAVVIDAAPDIFPVNHIVEHGTVVFRTAEGTKLAAALSGATVAFEADGFDREAGEAGEAWSVVVKGPASEIHDPDELIETFRLLLAPWQGSAKPRFVRISPQQITGRRFPVIDPATWSSPFTLRRRSPSD